LRPQAAIKIIEPTKVFGRDPAHAAGFERPIKDRAFRSLWHWQMNELLCPNITAQAEIYEPIAALNFPRLLYQLDPANFLISP